MAEGSRPGAAGWQGGGRSRGLTSAGDYRSRAGGFCLSRTWFRPERRRSDRAPAMRPARPCSPNTHPIGVPRR